MAELTNDITEDTNIDLSKQNTLEIAQKDGISAVEVTDIRTEVTDELPGNITITRRSHRERPLSNGERSGQEDSDDYEDEASRSFSEDGASGDRGGYGGRGGYSGRGRGRGRGRSIGSERGATYFPPASFLLGSMALTPGKAKEISRGEDAEPTDITTLMSNMMIFLSGKIDDATGGLSDQLDIQKQQIDANTNNVMHNMIELKAHTAQLNTLSSGQSELERRLDKLELQARYVNLIVSGVDESIKDLSGWYSNTLHGQLKLDSTVPIDKIYRLGKERRPPPNSSSPTRTKVRPRKIKIVFRSHGDRDTV